MIRASVEHQDRSRTFTIVEPAGASDTLFVFFHGSQQSGAITRKFTNNTFDALTSRGCYVAYPDGVEQHFNDARIGLNEETRRLGIDDVGFFRKIVAYMNRNFGTRRVFIAGYSNGGQMVMRLMHEAAHLISGAASIAANFPTPDNTLPEVLTQQPTAIPFFTMAGTADPFSPFTGGDAGINEQQRRGNGYSAFATAAYFANRNGLDEAIHSSRDEVVEIDRWNGSKPVEFWTLNGIGHLVPSNRDYPEFLGPSTQNFVAAEVIADFLGL